VSALSEDALRAALAEKRYGHSLTLLKCTTSTMDEARRAADNGAPDGHLIVAEAQTEGRGSRGHAWSSPPGKDLYVSLVLRPRLTPRDRPPLTLAVGLGVATVIAEETGEQTTVKWPNDVWLGGRKTAGVLVETSLRADREDAVLVGIGVNVNRDEFPAPLATHATSLRLATGRDWSRTDLLVRILAAIEPRIALLEQGMRPTLLAELTAHLALRGRWVRCADTHGRLLGVDDDGALLLERAGQRVRCLTGPLTLDEEPRST